MNLLRREFFICFGMEQLYEEQYDPNSKAKNNFSATYASNKKIAKKVDALANQLSALSLTVKKSQINSNVPVSEKF